MDRETLWCHFAFCTFSENGIICVRFPCFFERGHGFLKKKKEKAPARNAPVVVRACFHQKSKNQGILTKIRPFSEKVREAK